MKTTLRLTLAACTGLALAACGPQIHPTRKQMESLVGLSMDAVRHKVGGPYVVTNAGESVWWDYNNVAMPGGSNDGQCQVIFVNEVATKVRC
jgi:hypothetical protein